MAAESPFAKIRHPKKRAFLAAYSENGTVKHAAEIAKIHRQTHLNWLRADSDYVTAFTEAQGMAADTLEREARRRAAEGWEEPVFYQGDQVATIRKFSDTLLIFLLKGRRGEVFGDRITHEGNPDRPVHVHHSPRV